MQKRLILLLPLALSGLVFAILPSCSAGSGDDPGILNPTGSDSSGDGTSEIDPGFDVGGDHGAIVSLKVDPADSTLTVTDPAAPPTVDLKCIATFKDGFTAAIPASWTLDRYDIATIGAGSGTFTPSGKVGGKSNVVATVGTLTGTTSVTVALKLSIDAKPVDADDKKSLLAGSGPDPLIKSILYPYDKTVFPKGLLGPEVMWNGGGAGDAYLLRIHGPDIDVDLFATADPPSVLPIDTALWNTITTTATSGGKENDVTIELRRARKGDKAYVSGKETWRIADANLRGTIYYWAVDRGEIVKINPGATAPTAAFTPGDATSLGTPVPLNSSSAPTPAWQEATAGKRCIACHAVSKDGSRLVSTFSTPRGSTGPAGFVDLKTSTIKAIGDYQQNVMYVSLTPNGAKAVVNTTDMKLHLLDASSGAAIASALESIPGFSNDPAFSNDGKQLAFAGNVVGYYPVEYTASDLVVYDFDDATNAFSAPKVIVKGSGANDAIAFPSFSPDSKWIFFQRGNYSRAKYGDTTKGDYRHGNDDLYVVADAVGSAPIALDAMNGKGIVLGDNAHLNYQPTVNPIAEGGYFWVVFVSPRDYGNKMVSPQKAPPSDCTYANRKQLWVAAVDATMKGPDPSRPAFRLPGQLLEPINMNGYWTLSPCIPTPKDGSVASCSAGFECCSGFCRDVAGKPSCVDPPGGCHKVGEKCSTDADCCDAKCVGGFCSKSSAS